MKYDEFIESKFNTHKFDGIEVNKLGDYLYQFQQDIVRWSLKRGRAAIFADCGMGKTIMQLEWAKHITDATHGRVLILAPLAVAEQTVSEGSKFGIDVKYLRHDDAKSPIVIANYEMLDHFKDVRWNGVVLDESSILKSYDGKTRNSIIQAFGGVPYRLACTATPAPNDHQELGNHSEFLGIKSRTEMLSEYFVHDGKETQKWRLKGHAENRFWQWVCSWAVMLRYPSDLGYDDGSFILPPLEMRQVEIPCDPQTAFATGMLFLSDAETLNEQRALRRATLSKRLMAISGLIDKDKDNSWLIWCEYNIEGDSIEKTLPESVQVQGSDTIDIKVDRLLGFASGKYKILITKPSIAGFGMNWQICHNVVFVGPSHSYEQTYQAIRRCWRFGQHSPVTVYTITAEGEGEVIRNYQRKEKEANAMAIGMLKYMRAIQEQEIRGAAKEWNEYAPVVDMDIPKWLKGGQL